ncbi:MAG: hypothetical protein ABI857_00725 [Acidobacteriota bacterium]
MDLPEKVESKVVDRLTRYAEKISVVKLTSNREVDDFIRSLQAKRTDQNGN